MRSCVLGFGILLATVAASVGAVPSAYAGSAPPPSISDFSCSGPVHTQAINLWETVARPYFTQQITRGLNQLGDVYVLYYTQEELQSFVEMTRRCKDTQQINELAETLNPVFDSLRPLPDDPASKGWVCTGGSTCTQANKLLGTEVQLCSAQFLGLLGAVATDIVENVPVSKRTPAEKSFLTDASSAMAVQVNHWLSPQYFAHVAERMRMTPASVRNGSPTYFFADRDLWFMTTLSDLSELHAVKVSMTSAGNNAFRSLQSKDNQIASLFDLFVKRTSIIGTSDGARATLDRAYWREYADNSYALYTAPTSPVLCRKNARGAMEKTLRVKAQAIFVDPDMGWDISHARRLVPALNTFVRNKSNITNVFDYSSKRFNPAVLQRAFANQIVSKIWDKDSNYPLFGNYWDGSNGWYRAGYDNGTGHCDAGNPPFGLAWSIPTGGYPEWGAINPTIQSISRRIYFLLESTDPQSVTFINQHYPQLRISNTASSNHGIWTMTFLASLVDT